MISDIILTIGALFLCYFLVAKWRFIRSSNIPIRQLYLFFTIQASSSVILYMIYTHIYTDRNAADIFKFYDDASLLYHELFLTSPSDYLKLMIGFDHSPSIQAALHKTAFWYKPFETYLFNDNQTIIRLNLFVRLFSFGSYGVHALFFTFLSFTGLIAIFKSFNRFFEDKLFTLKTACFLVPSVLIWTSGILKESVLLFALGLLVYQLSSFIKDHRFTWKRVSLTICSIGLLLIIKPYVLIVLTPGILTMVLWELGIAKKMAFAFLASISMILLPILTLGNYISSFNIPHILFKMQQDFINVAHLSHAHSYFEIGLLNGSFSSVLIRLPESLYNALLRPFSFFDGSILTIVSSTENLIILLLLIYGFTHRAKVQERMKGLWLLLIGFCLCLFILIGLTVPVEGAIVRYKAPVLPFLLIVIFSFTNTSRLLKIKAKIYPLWIKKLLS